MKEMIIREPSPRRKQIWKTQFEKNLPQQKRLERWRLEKRKKEKTKKKKKKPAKKLDMALDLQKVSLLDQREVKAMKSVFYSEELNPYKEEFLPRIPFLRALAENILV